VTRTRLTHVAAALATIALGLLVHLKGAFLGDTARDVIGDALWASMIVWSVGAIVPRAQIAVRTLAAYGVCVAVEVSQLYHTPWLDAVRATRLGQLTLGSGFDSRDLVAYALGVCGAAIVESLLCAR
jgi:hypothetical protein